MCGIIGIASSDKELISSMVASQSHRGPDDSGFFVDDLVSLGNCRLKIIDLSPKGHQPMCNEDGTIWITYNGEIYNAAVLRKELEAKGHEFKSDSDTECIIHGYETWGPGVVKKLDGMWGFCIYDSVRKKLFLSRDRMGVKPLNYLLTKDNFAFSSELKVFAELPQLRRPLSTAAVAEQLMFGFNPSSRTVLHSVFKLGAGENLIYDLKIKETSINRYWNNQFEKKNTPDLRYVEKLIDDSIDLHLVSDVPVGCYLSGGIDSSTIAWKWSERYTKELHTFTIGFDNESGETELARDLAALIGSNHHELVLNSEFVANNLADIFHFYDLTMDDSAFIPNYFISKLARKYVTVTLAGEGGDEIFGGYDYYKKFARLERLVPSQKIRKLSAGLALGMYQSRNFRPLKKGLSKFRKSSKTEQTEENVNKGLYLVKYEGNLSEFLYGYLGKAPFSELSELMAISSFDSSTAVSNLASMSTILELDQVVQLAEKFNYKADRSTSAASLEERVPFQEFHLVEYMNSIPNSLKFNEKDEKIILKSIIRSKLPQIAARRKRGYDVPISNWLKGSLDGALSLSIDMIKSLKVVDHERLLKSYKKFRQGEATKREETFLWNILVTAGGLERYGYL